MSSFPRIVAKIPKPIHQGLDAGVHYWIGRYRRRSGVLGELRRQAEAIDALAPELVALSNHQLQDRLLECRRAFQPAGHSNPDLP